MAYEYLGTGELDYSPCRYGNSKLMFRGPKRPITGHYNVAIGGSETFGKYVEDPFPQLLENLSGQRVINLGCMYASADAFANDNTILEICKAAQVTIIQLSGAQNMSNRFYRVHPRRNDRFLGGTDLLRSIYPELDFSGIHFTGHLISMLSKNSTKRFELVRDNLQAEWVARMQALLGIIGGKIVLLWLADHPPSDEINASRADMEPMFLNRQMIDQLSGYADTVEVIITQDEIDAGHDRMIFSQLEQPASRQMLGPIAHQEAARQLYPVLAEYCGADPA